MTQAITTRLVAAGGDASRETSGENDRLLEMVRAGDEKAFMELVENYGDSMRRVASLYVSSRAVADEVVQEAWLGVITGLGRFEGRCSLKTWIMSILKHKAKSRARSEGRSVPFSSLGGTESAPDEPSVAPERFLDRGERWVGEWASPPRDWSGLPEGRLVSRETLALAQGAIAALPPNQRAVIELRDVQEWDSAEVCEYLEISEGNQRVLLHRARSKVRRALEDYFNEVDSVPR